MEYEGLTNESLQLLHGKCKEAYFSDREFGEVYNEYAESFTSFGVDRYSVWPKVVDRLEAEMTKRSLQFDPIKK